MTTEEATPNTQGHARSASAGCSKPRLAPRLEAVGLRCAESAAGPAVELDGPTVQPANGCRPPALRTDLPRDDLAHETLRSLSAARNRARGARPSRQAERLPERATHYPPSARSSRVRLTCFSSPGAAAPSPQGVVLHGLALATESELVAVPSGAVASQFFFVVTLSTARVASYVVHSPVWPPLSKEPDRNNVPSSRNHSR